MQIKKDRGIQMIENGRTVLVGTLRGTTKTHYRIEVPGTGELDMPRDDAEFAGASRAEVVAWAEQQKQQQKQKQSKPQNSERTYTVAGYSTLMGRRRLRLSCNLEQRRARLQQCGDTDIELRQLPEPMTRQQAREWLQQQGID